MSSEEYLDKLLREMNGEVDDSDSIDNKENDIVIDSAPSLNIESVNDENNDISSNDISDLMADIMPSFDAGLDSVNSEENNFINDSPNMDSDINISELYKDKSIGELADEYYSDEENTESDLMDNSDSEISDFEYDKLDDNNIGDSITGEYNIDDSSTDEINADDFPSMPHAPEIPDGNIKDNKKIENFDLEPITAENFDEKFEDIEINDKDSINIKDNFLDVNDLKRELASGDFDDLENESGEEDIDFLIKNAQKSSEDGFSIEDASLEDLLETSNDGETSSISDLLEKAERNEAVDEGVSALLENNDAPIDLENLDNQAIPSSKEEKKAEKKRLKEEKKEAKRKAKEEKAAAKAAAKAEKAAKKARNTKMTESNAETEDMSDVEALLEGAERAATNSENVFDKVNSSETVASTLEKDSSEVKDSSETADHLEAEDYSEGTDTSDTEGSSEGTDMGETEGLSEESSTPETTDSSDGINTAEPTSETSDLETSTDEGDEKKQNFFSKLIGKFISFITEEDDDVDEKSELILSDENAAILDELNAEGDGKKKKKGKKSKKNAKADGDSEVNPEDLPEKKEKKKKKEKKPKKIKEETGKPEKKIPAKTIGMILLVAITLGAVLILVIKLNGDYSVKRAGRQAYQNGDYQTCYQNLYGKELTETEEIMYNHSECILKIKLWLKEYEVLAEEGSEEKALDSLIQSINAYPGLYVSAQNWGCVDKIEPYYNEMYQILNDKYNLSEEDAIAIASEEDDIVYTRLIYAIVSGVSYQDAYDYITGNSSDLINSDDNESNNINSNINNDLNDKLPEEDELSKDSFIEP